MGLYSVPDRCKRCEKRKSAIEPSDMVDWNMSGRATDLWFNGIKILPKLTAI